MSPLLPNKAPAGAFFVYTHAMSLSLLTLSPTPETLAAVQRLADGNPAYYRAVTGNPAPADAGRNLFDDHDLPPETRGKQRLQLGFERAGQMVAVADVMRGHPSPHTAWLGWLLVDSSLHGQGIGRAALGLIREHILYVWPETHALRLSVVETNTEALTFWPHMGFTDTGERKPYSDGPIESTVWVFEMRL